MIDTSDLKEWDKAKAVFQPRLDAWDTNEINATAIRRELRKVDVNNEAQRLQGRLASNETFVPVRIIDNNIRQALAKFMSYLRSGKRLVLFTPVNPTTKLNVQLLEESFSNGMRYLEWDVPWEREVDGMLTHGWNFMQVIYDESKPLKVAVDFIPHERVVIPLDMEDFQSLEFVPITYNYVPSKLKSYVKTFGFNAAQVDLLLATVNEKERDKPIKCYRVMFKDGDGVVWDAWFSMKCTAWLRAPAKLDLGMQKKVEVDQPMVIDPMTGMVIQQEPITKMVPVDITEYPLFPLYMMESEDPRVPARKGMTFYANNKQEAASSLLTSFINANRFASGFYPYKDQQGDGSSVKQDDKLIIQHNKMLNQKIGAFQPAYPDQTMMMALQAITTQNANEVGDVTNIIQNKQGSRTTAKEVESAEADDALVSSSSLLQLSRTIQRVYTFCWMLVRNYANNGELLIVPDPANPEQNDLKLLNAAYVLKPAGDIDFVQREELKALFLQFWPVVQNTPIAGMFLAKIMRMFFPEDGEEFASKLESGDPAQLVAALLELIKAEPPPQGLPPEVQTKLANIIQQAESYVQQSASVGAKPNVGATSTNTKPVSGVSPQA